MQGSIYTHISENKRQTFYIMFLFIALISAIGWVFGRYYGGSGFGFMGFALIISGITSFFSYYNSDKIVLRMATAKEVTAEENQYLHDLVDNMCIASGLPKPKIYMTQDSAMNAFATGRDPEHAALCFTSGIVKNLDKRELEGVVAHELSHVGNYDIRLMSIVSILVGTIAMASDWFTRGMFFGGRDDDNNRGGGVFFIIGLVLLVLSPLVATIIKMAVSRNREYLADSTGALLTRNPRALASALAKISGDPTQMHNVTGATAHMWISNPLKSSSIANLFNTHPPVQERIKRLMSM